MITMSYIYDIILNLNNEFIEFYEWDKSDYLTHIRKIPIYKISNISKIKIGNKINNYKFIESIKNKTYVFGKNNRDYLVLLCNEEKVLAISLNNKGYIKEISDLLIDEEDYILESYNKYPFAKLDIIDNTKVYNYFFTRKEREKIKNVKKQIKKSKSNVLNYLCYELNIKEINDEEINKKYQEMYNFFNLIHNKK
jgi:hypothetical protein